MQPASDPVTVALTGALPFLLITAAVLALPVSLTLLALYRRAVLRSMRAQSMKGEAAGEPWPAVPPGSHPEGPHAPAPSAGSTTAALLDRYSRAPWRLAAVYAAGGVGYALVLTTSWYAATSIDVSPYRFLVTFYNYAWPIVLSVGLVALSSGRGRSLAVLAYAVMLGLLGVVTAAEPRFWSGVFLLWVSSNALPTLLLLGFLHRRVRAVGPLVFAFTFLAALGSVVTLALVGSSDAGLALAVDLGGAVGLGAGQIFLAMVLVGFASFGVVGWLAVRWIRGRYERKRMSDQSILLDSVWIIFTVSHSLSLVFEGAAWVLAGPAAFLVYKGVTWIGLSLLVGEPGSGVHSPKLLLLRVFSLGRRSERLYDVIGLHWRHIGSIRMIAGPDLATSTVEPHEFLDFLTGGLAHRFIDGPAALQRSIAEMDLAPDHDGRFRVSEFFCRDDTWKHALARLVGDSDVVLMDVRGFSEQNAGCRYELEALIDTAPLSRVVLVEDRTTDAAFLERIVREAWTGMRPDSPNRGGSPEQLRRIHVAEEESRAKQALLDALCTGARAKPLPVPAS